MPHPIIYAPATKAHLNALTAYERSIVFAEVDKHLAHEPDKVTKRHAPLRDQQGNATEYWKLRLGNLRVYYYIGRAPKAAVNIVAIGRKEGEQVRIGNHLITMDELVGWLNETLDKVSYQEGTVMNTLSIDEMANLLHNEPQADDQQPVVLTVEGKPYAALIPLASLKSGSDEPAVAALKNVLRMVMHLMPQEEAEDMLEDAFIDTNPQLISILDQSKAELEAGGGYTAEEMRREFGLH